MSWAGKDIFVRIINQNDARIGDMLTSRIPRLRLVQSAPETDGLKILLSFRPPDDEPLEAYDWVHSAGAGVDHLCRAISNPANAPLITRTAGRMGQQIGEYCLAYALAHLQGMAFRRALQTKRSWQHYDAAPAYLFSARVAIIGTGSIGSGIARAFSGLGAKVTGYSRTGSPSPVFDVVRPVSQLESEDAPDILVLALPATPETDGLVSTAMLSNLHGAFLINVGRGSTLDAASLRKALDSGQVEHAVLDVFETEPLPQDDWRWVHPNVTVTPHVSGPTLPDDAANALCDLLESYLETGDKPVSVDVRRGY